MAGESLPWIETGDRRVPRIAWLEDGELLWVDFGGGNLFCFLGVPRGTYNGMLRAASKLRYARIHVIGRFDFTRRSR